MQMQPPVDKQNKEYTEVSYVIMISEKQWDLSNNGLCSRTYACTRDKGFWIPLESKIVQILLCLVFFESNFVTVLHTWSEGKKARVCNAIISEISDLVI